MPQHLSQPTRRNRRLTRTLVAATAAATTSMCIAPLAIAAPPGGGPNDPGGPIGGTVAQPVVMFVDGSKPVLSNEADGAANIAGGYYAELDGFQLQWVPTTGGFGILTGPNDTGYDETVEITTANTVAGIKQARLENPGMPIAVVSLSQGAHAASDALAQLEAEGFDTSNLHFLYAGSPVGPGGILSRIPGPGVYVPFAGITLGGQQPAAPSETATQTYMVLQYDGIADAPKYLLNLPAVANAILGTYYLHGTYDDIDLLDPDRIVTTSEDGMTSHILYPTKQLPLTMPFRGIVPDEILDAVDPFLRAIIETGYDREDPLKPEQFELAPPPDQWADDAESIAQGAQQTGQALVDIASPAPAVTPEPDLTSLRSDASLTGSQSVSGGQPQQLSVPAGQEVVKQPDPEKKPETGFVRNSFRAVPGQSGDDNSPNGRNGPVRQAVRGITKSLRDTVSKVSDSVKDSLDRKPADKSDKDNKDDKDNQSTGAEGGDS